eukprot:6905031-Pyramimonas_sp.AAC.1
MTDLRMACGLEDVGFQFIKRQLGYLSHLARYPEDRIEGSCWEWCWLRRGDQKASAPVIFVPPMGTVFAR